MAAAALSAGAGSEQLAGVSRHRLSPRALSGCPGAPTGPLTAAYEVGEESYEEG